MNSHLTRRQALGGLLAVGLLASVPRTALATPSPNTGTLDLEGIEHRHRARIGAYAVDLGTAATVAHRADERFAMCSTFKAYAAGRVLQLVDQGRLDLRTPIPVNAADIVANSPVTEQRVGTTMALAEVCEAALTRSDNAAGNLLLRTIGGPGEVTAFARTLGDDQTRLDRWETELNSAIPGDIRDTTTPPGALWGLPAGAHRNSAQSIGASHLGRVDASQRHLRTAISCSRASRLDDRRQDRSRRLWIHQRRRSHTRSDRTARDGSGPHPLDRRPEGHATPQRCDLRHRATHPRQLRLPMTDQLSGVMTRTPHGCSGTTCSGSHLTDAARCVGVP